MVAKSIEKTFTHIGVDAGIIAIADRDFYREYKGRVSEDYSKLGKKITLPIGKYNVDWSIANTWRGNVSGRGKLYVTSGEVLVCDPCYVIRNYSEWDRILKETDFLRKPPTGILVLDKMGGDGEYTVEATFTPTTVVVIKKCK
jgi:hypothetical protein